MRAAAILLLVLAALVAARRLGLPDVVCGVAFATSLLLVLARLLASELGLLGPARAVRWSQGLMLAAMAPLLVSVHPGAQLAQGELRLPGDMLDLGPQPPREVLLAVAADVEEGDSLTYRLLAGHMVQSVTVLRRSFRSSRGGQSAHWHEDRPSAILELALDPGVHAIQLEEGPASGLPLRVRVFSRWLNPALPSAAALLALGTLVVAIARFRSTRRAVQLASMMVAGGLGSGFVATPDHALRAALAGLAAGVVLGIPGGAVLDWVVHRVRR